MIARAGSGHIGTSFSSMDIVAWLYMKELNRDTDLYFSSKGHDVPALYAILAARGLLDFEKIHALRRLGGLPGHPDVGTPHIAANTGSLGMGISKAKGMSAANRLQKKPGHVYVLTGDGELQEGQFWESLPSAVNRKISDITVIIDHNKIQSDTWVKDVADLGDLPRKLESFGWHVARCDGHDFASLSKAFAGLKKVADRPKILVADTIKGKGVSFMEQTAGEKLYRFHSGAPDEETYNRAVTEPVDDANRKLREAGAAHVRLESVARPEKKRVPVVERLVGAYSKALVRAAESNPKVVVLDADLVLDCGLIPFSEKFPDRFIECGIAEQDMVSQAGGLALRGMLPVVHSFACFLSSRPNEQIYNNATEGRKVVYVGSLAGLLPGGPGHSHQCVRDISSLSAVPGLVLLEPSCESEVDLAVDYCINGSPQSFYLRLVSIPVAVPYRLPAGYRLQPGRGSR
jgi:transketolase